MTITREKSKKNNFAIIELHSKQHFLNVNGQHLCPPQFLFDNHKLCFTAKSDLCEFLGVMRPYAAVSITFTLSKMGDTSAVTS